MKLKKIFSRTHIILTLLAVGMVTVILLALPHSDYQSYSYELNQPWRYQLLTAQFDVPIVRDSATTRLMRDSIDRTFVPFVKRLDDAGYHITSEFTEEVKPITNQRQRNALTSALRKMYEEGIVDPDLYDIVQSEGSQLRTVADGNSGYNTAVSFDASGMRTPALAFTYIDSIYNAVTPAPTDSASRNARTEIYKLLNSALVPNVVIDTITDLKFRNQEYLNVTGAIGVIKKGQRIVDRGEIITPQILTNLDTYTAMLQRQQDDVNTIDYTMLGQGLYIAMMVVMLYLFLMIYRPRFFFDLRKMVFLTSYITIFIVAVILAFTHITYGIYLMPFAMVPVVILIFFDSRTAIISLLVTVLITALMATYQFTFIVTELSVGLFATFSLRQLSKRSQLLRAAFVSFVAYCFCFFVCHMVASGQTIELSAKIFGTFAINSVILSFAYILIVVIEKIFGFISSVTLVELSDINSPLLRRLAEETPGTFQHSMQVSALGAEAARAIGANALLVRTGALYHDIGKLESPYFYTENQHGINPHEGLDPETSAKKIISHVSNGLTLASKYKLPQRIADFISQHHGKGVTRYFYNTAINESPDGNVDREPFTYPGPNPTSKETAILMMADAVEAASRSLKNYSAQEISDLVDRIVDGQEKEGLFNDSPLAFNELNVIKNTFKKRLATIYHTRIKYPEVKKTGEGS